MPLYTYVCKDCGAKFDILIGVSSQKEELKCSKCSSKNIQRVFSSFGVGGSKDKFDSSGPSCSTGTCPTCFS